MAAQRSALVVAATCATLAGCSLDWPTPTVTSASGGAAAGGNGAGGSAAGGNGGAGGQVELSPECKPCSSLTLPSFEVNNVVDVTPADDLQAIVDAAQPGDVLRLAVGEYPMQLRLPPNPGPRPIRLQGAKLDEIAVECTRVQLPDVPLLPTILGPEAAPALRVVDGSNWQVVGVRFSTASVTPVPTLVAVGLRDEPVLDNTPRNIHFDRVVVDGGPEQLVIRGFVVHGRNIRISNSRVADLLVPDAVGDFSYAIVGNNLAGPLHVLNNKLESTRAVLALGVAGPGVTGIVPTDVVLQYNHGGRPNAWNAISTQPTHIRSVVEIRNGSGVLIDGNVFDNVESDAAVVLVPDSLIGEQSWARVDDVTLQNNVFTGVDGKPWHSLGSIVLRIEEGLSATLPTTDIVFRNNLVHSGNGRFLQLGQTDELHIGRVEFRHNTLLQPENFANINNGDFGEFVMVDNIVDLGPEGIKCNMVFGEPCLDLRFGLWTLANNLLKQPTVGSYSAPPNQLITTDFGFVDPGNNDYRLAPASPGIGAASDGGDVGVDFEELGTASACRSPDP